jgi:eukaryotic-like serine/threonine-protein kinase
MDQTDHRIGTDLIGRYRILAPISSGGMGVVYRAERLKLGRVVAIKFLNADYAATDEGKRLFELEAVAASRLSHPNCVPVIDFGVQRGEPFLVMEFVAGRSLRDVLDEDGRLAPPRAVELTRQVLAGLAHAHGQGVIHRDVKPENILVAKVEGHGEQPRLLDFGLGKLRGQKSVISGVAPGTPSYISPELTRGLKVDERADIYAVGIILYELLAGQKPFAAKALGELLRMHREKPPPTLASVAPEVAISAALEAAIDRALVKDRDERFPTAEAFSEALATTPEARGEVVASRAAAPEPMPAEPAPMPAEPASQARTPKLGIPLFALVALLAAAALWAVLF